MFKNILMAFSWILSTSNNFICLFTIKIKQKIEIDLENKIISLSSVMLYQALSQSF